MNTIVRTFGVYILCFLAVFAILYFFAAIDLVLNFLTAYILYRLLKENGI